MPARLTTRDNSTIRLRSGFTLIELVVVIVILGILAAIALPRFVSLGTEARVASTQALAGALHTAANQTRALCMVTSGCDTTTDNWVGTLKGRTYWLSQGWPDAGDSINSGRIDTLLDYSGFQAIAVAWDRTRFEVVDAPTPATCSVTYIQANSTTTQNYTIQVATSGC